MEQESTFVDYKTVRKIGGSLTISLPPPYARARGIRDGQRVKITYTSTSMIITPIEVKESTGG